MKRREFLATAGGAAVMAASSRTRAAGAMPPNVVYVFSDEHRYQSMSIGEMRELHTPNMAALARQGTSFTQCISNYPVCSPYRGILQTGRWPYQTGVIDNNEPLNPDDDTIGKAFQAAGYHTGYIGKWHLGGVRAEPFGYDTSLIWTGVNTHYNKAKYHPTHGGPVQPEGYNAALMTDQALSFMDTHSAKPFFLMLSLNPPHADFLGAPSDKKELYPEGSLSFRPNYGGAKAGVDAPSIARKNAWPHYQGYHAHISAIDDQLGRVMAKIDELGIADNTILIYTSDHGSMFGSHGLGSKRQPYEESIRVPFIARWPGEIQADKVRPDLFGAIDKVPTLCGLAGVDAPSECGGRDFSPQVRGESGPIMDPQFIMHISKLNASGGNNHPAPLFRGLRTSSHTFACYPDRPWCLFDNANDPYQQRNLINDAAFIELRRTLRARLQNQMASAEDPLTLPTF
jgi:arylsulfatase A-like enzyme